MLRNILSLRVLVLLGAGLGLLSAARAQTPGRRPVPTPSSEVEKKLWMDQGRILPVPELLQPTLDSALPAFVPQHGQELSGHLTGAASDVLAYLTKDWVAAFQKFYPHVQIDVPPPYAGSLGALELIKGKLDFVTVSRELKPTDISGFAAKFGYPPLTVPISGGTYRHFGFLDSIVFFVNQANPLKQLTLAQLDAVLSSTRHHGGPAITTWGQLGLKGEWADKPIHVWAVKPWNGFEEFVRERVLSPGQTRGEWRKDLNYVETVFPIAPHVAEDKYAIGYAGLAYVGPGVNLLSLSTDGGPAVPPDYEEVARATYPLSRLVYINLNKTPGKAMNPLLEEFVRFILSREGQQVIRHQAIYLPLRENQAAASRAQLAAP
ncbi:MAG: PstS family phosphate ABC transporter substrate-binding protein [Opitutales bacterium]